MHNSSRQACESHALQCRYVLQFISVPCFLISGKINTVNILILYKMFCKLMSGLVRKRVDSEISLILKIAPLRAIFCIAY